jgi:hypothetical protein
MFKFGEYLTEKTEIRKAISAGGKNAERHYNQYIKDYLPGEKLHGPGSHQLATDHVDPQTGVSFPAGSRVHLIHNENKNGVNHVTISDENGNESVVKASKLAKTGNARNPEQVEDDQIAQMQNGIDLHKKTTGGSSARIRFGDGNYVDAAGIKKVTKDDWKKMGYDGKGAPKADAYFHDENGNPTHFISLKGTRHQQWGGATHIANHPAVQRAVGEIGNKLDAERSADPEFSGAVRHSLDPNDEHDRDLIHKSMYGMKHGKEYGLSNVHRIIGGNISLATNANGELNLNSDKSYTNTNDKDSDTHNDTSAIFRTSGDRNNFSLGGRVLIAPTEVRRSARPTASTARKEAIKKAAEAPVEATPSNGHRAPSAIDGQHRIAGAGM